MAYTVQLKPGHPTGYMNRGGYRFGYDPLTLDDVSAAITNEPWLVVRAVEAEVAPTPAAKGKSKAKPAAARPVVPEPVTPEPVMDETGGDNAGES